MSQPPGTTGGGPLPGGGFDFGFAGWSFHSLDRRDQYDPAGLLRPTVVPRDSYLLDAGGQPDSPRAARVSAAGQDARVQGSVVLFALISKAGTMENLHVLSGPPLLVPAAIDAVSQWRYRPYILNSEPIEVETQITVNFIVVGELKKNPEPRWTRSNTKEIILAGGIQAGVAPA